MLRSIAISAGAALRATGRVAPALLLDAAGLAAVGLIAYGAWLIAPPAGFITGGVLLLVGVALLSAKGARQAGQ